MGIEENADYLNLFPFSTVFSKGFFFKDCHKLGLHGTAIKYLNLQDNMVFILSATLSLLYPTNDFFSLVYWNHPVCQ